MLDEYLNRIETIIAELRQLLAQADIPEAKAQEINAKLELMLEIVAQYE